MAKVKLLDSKRFLEDEDANFVIKAGQEKELLPRDLKSIAIRGYLWNGVLLVTEGELEFQLKSAHVVAKPDGVLEVNEGGNRFVKNVPDGAVSQLEPKDSESSEEEPVEEELEEEEKPEEEQKDEEEPEEEESDEKEEE